MENFIFCAMYEFLTGKDVLPKKDLLQKTATIKRFEYSPLGKELKAQTDIAKKQYQTLDTIYESDEKEEPKIKKYNKSNLIYNSKYSFYKHYSDRKKFDNISFESKNSFLNEFFNYLIKFNKLTTQKEETQKKKQMWMIQLQNYIMDFLKSNDKYNKFSDAKKRKLGDKYDPKELFL